MEWSLRGLTQTLKNAGQALGDGDEYFLLAASSLEISGAFSDVIPREAEPPRAPADGH
jgi:hypothetical protein